MACGHVDNICANLERVSEKVLQEECPAAAEELREWMVDFSEKLKCRLQEGLTAKLSFWSDLPYLALGSQAALPPRLFGGVDFAGGHVLASLHRYRHGVVLLAFCGSDKPFRCHVCGYLEVRACALAQLS